MIADRCFGALQKWYGEHGIASSGHSLWEAMVLRHVALEGNGLKVLSRMDIAGLDMLSSDPEAVIHSGSAFRRPSVVGWPDRAAAVPQGDE